jgi:hypothetical protein
MIQRNTATGFEQNPIIFEVLWIILNTTYSGVSRLGFAVSLVSARAEVCRFHSHACCG